MNHFWFVEQMIISMVIIPLVRGPATLVAAARDDLGRLRVLDVSEWGAVCLDTR